MIDFQNHRLFTPHQHPESGVTFYVLTQKVAPLQKGFYFVNDCMGGDGRYLWFCCAFPPSLVKTLAVLDFATQTIRHFPETQFSAESPFVDSATGDAYWCVGNVIWRRGPEAADTAREVNTLSPEVAWDLERDERDDRLRGATVSQARGVRSLATHLTRSADGKAFFIDASVGLRRVFGALPIDGGNFAPWWRFDRTYNHAQFSPTDPDVALFAEENHNDPLTGLTFPIVNRLWWIRKGSAPRPVLREPQKATHEWWDADGKHVWCVKQNETWRVRLRDGEIETIPFPRRCWHSHSSRDGRLIVGDAHNGFYRGCASTVHFMNRETGKIVVIAEHAPQHGYAGRNYHIDPHPRFCCGDQYVVFTTTVRNAVDLAIVPVSTLLDSTA